LVSELEEPLSEDDFDDEQPKAPGVVGRIVEPDEGASPDDEADAVASETDDATALSAEEAAMHVTDDPDNG
jgi:hypothetical protein